MYKRCSATLRLAATFSIAAAISFGAATSGMTAGKAELKSAGPLAFGPEGVLFVGDQMAGTIVALDTGDRTAAAAPSNMEVKGINEKVAAILGTAPDQILINDMAVNPLSKKVYLSVSRGRGPDATPVILRVDASGKISEFALDNVKHSTVQLPNPAAGKDQRGNNRRLESITDLAYVDGKVIVAGLSNEEFSSNLRSIPFPFQAADSGASIEIFHGAHGRFETNSPVRTLVAYEIKNQPHILAAYTCTPLVRIPMSELKAGNKVKGATIAELGNRNRPLDMIIYSKSGRNYLMMANSSRGVMKMSADGLDSYEPITAQTEKAGVPYETISTLTGVQQLAKVDDNTAVIIAGEGSSLDLRTIPLT
jgi:hypothetical protein